MDISNITFDVARSNSCVFKSAETKNVFTIIIIR